MTDTKTRPGIDDRSVWVGCLACYNNGNLVGRWLFPEDGPDWKCPHSDAEQAAGYGPHEEFWVMDHQCFGDWLHGECSPQHAADIAELIDAIEGEGQDPDVVAAWAKETGETITEWDSLSQAAFSEAYRGAWDSIEAYAQEHVAEHGWNGVSAEDCQKLWGCLNFEHIGEELAQELTEIQIGSTLHLFGP